MEGDNSPDFQDQRPRHRLSGKGERFRAHFLSIPPELVPMCQIISQTPVECERVQGSETSKHGTCGVNQGEDEKPLRE